MHAPPLPKTAQVLPIPELVPFRLTRQLCGPLLPLDAREVRKWGRVGWKAGNFRLAVGFHSWPDLG